MTMTMTRLCRNSRGIRNCNPLNIRRTNTKWKGLRPEVTDKAFCEFVSLPWGFRAAFLNLRTYWSRGWRTVDAIISHWAPPSDGNNTAAYIRRVKAYLREEVPRFCVDDPLPGMTALNTNVWCSLVEAMASVECGVGPEFFSESVYDGFKLATEQK